MTDVTQILNAIEEGDPSAADQLLPIVYGELRRLAKARMAKESPDHTLQATGLVHEAFLRLVDVDQAQRWRSRDHFFSAAAEAMRRILIESARRKQREKRGGGVQRQDADLDRIALPMPSEELILLDQALQDLAASNPPVAELVKLRYFCGLTMEEASSVLGISCRTAGRYWAYAKARLHHQVRESGDG
jgi:RNA polymerase sigma factor (TIGR02999 family)